MFTNKARTNNTTIRVTGAILREKVVFNEGETRD